MVGSLHVPVPKFLLNGGPHDVAIVDNNNVIVTLPWQKHLQFIQLLPSLKLGHPIDSGKKCWGVTIAASKIFVSYYNTEITVGEIRVYGLAGRDLYDLNGGPGDECQH